MVARYTEGRQEQSGHHWCWSVSVRMKTDNRPNIDYNIIIMHIIIKVCYTITSHQNNIMPQSFKMTSIVVQLVLVKLRNYNSNI